MEEFCPNCGTWVKELNDETGWCQTCHPVSVAAAKAKTERWLAANADAIEEYEAQGHSFTRAKQLVRNDNRPNCLSCGKPIKGGRSGKVGSYRALVCTTTVQCRKTQRRYRTLRDRFEREGFNKQDSRDAAIEQIVREIGERTIEYLPRSRS
jgi:hypothetical protein